MELSKRLKAVAACVKQGGTVADVGTDHGYVPIDLVQKGIVQRAIAMDVNPGPLQRAQAHIRAWGLEGKIETRLGDGLMALRPGEADTAVIAGMGGPLMVRILTEGLPTARSLRRLVLSPQSEIGQVRKFLISHQFAITEEQMVEEDGKFYTILCAEPDTYIEPRQGQAAAGTGWQAYQWVYGKCLAAKKDPVFQAFLKKEQDKYRAVARQLAHPKGEAQAARKQEVETALSYIAQVFAEMEEEG